MFLHKSSEFDVVASSLQTIEIIDKVTMSRLNVPHAIETDWVDLPVARCPNARLKFSIYGTMTFFIYYQELDLELADILVHLVKGPKKCVLLLTAVDLKASWRSVSSHKPISTQEVAKFADENGHLRFVVHLTKKWSMSEYDLVLLDAFINRSVLKSNHHELYIEECDEVIAVDKSLLLMHSDVFAADIADRTDEEDRVHIIAESCEHDIDYLRTLQNIVRWMYVGRIAFDGGPMALDVLRIAHEFKIAPLVDISTKFLVVNMSSTFVLRVLEWANVLKMDGLLRVALDHLLHSDSKANIAEWPFFEQMSETTSKKVLEHLWNYRCPADLYANNDRTFLKLDNGRRIDEHEHIQLPEVIDRRALLLRHYLSRTGADITIKVYSQEIHANKFYLSVFSTVFRRELEHSNVVNISNHTPIAINILIRSLYTGDINFEGADDNAVEVLAAAVEFKIAFVVKKCTTYLIEHLQIRNSVQILICSDSLDVVRLRDASVEFIAKVYYNTNRFPVQFEHVSDKLKRLVFGAVRILEQEPHNHKRKNSS